MSAKWYSILILGILALGAGIGLATTFMPARKVATPSKPREPVALLRIEDNKTIATAESGVESQRDTWFANPSDQPVATRLDMTDCQCAHVLLCVAPNEWKERDAPELLKRAADPALKWQPLEPKGEAVTVPPRTVGLLRVKWKTPTVGEHIFWADLLVENGQDQGKQRLNVPVHFVEPVRIRAEDEPNRAELDVGQIKVGEERTAHFVCFSLTREKFTITPASPGDDPCVNYGSPQALSPEELQSLSENLRGTVRSGYRVAVQVREQAGDIRLDLGPFRRQVTWATDVFPGHEVATHICGTVLGEVVLAGSPSKSLIDLGTISPASPKPLTFTLESHDPQVQLSLDEEKTLHFLQVDLLDGKEGKATDHGKSWQIRVQFRPDSLFRGPIPNADRAGYDTAIACSLVFSISRPGSENQRPRRLFVPVQGMVLPDS
jgi:hypothetical protein